MYRKTTHFVAAIITLLLIVSSIQADDTEIFFASTCTSDEDYRFIFIVDNSGSMDSAEFIQSKATIDATITRVLDSLTQVEVAIVQYGSSATGEHDYHITVPFTSDQTTALNWQRAFGSSGFYKPDYIQDHQPGSLAKMRRDNVYSSGGALDITMGTNVQFVFFTDASRDVSGCCSSIVAESTTYAPTATVYPMFGEYDALKDGSVYLVRSKRNLQFFRFPVMMPLNMRVQQSRL